MTITTLLVLAQQAALVSGRAVPEQAVWFSKPVLVDLSTYRGDSGRLRITVIDPDGEPLDVTGATWGCEIRATLESPDVLITLDVEPVPGDVAAVDLVLTPDKSIMLGDDNVWDVEMQLGDSVNTLFAGHCFAVGDVTRPART
jgi:hypothetical protein